MRRTYLLLVFSLLIPSFAQANVAYQKVKVRGTYAHVITANLNSPNVKVSPAVARSGIGTSEGFGSMLSRLQPTAAITGTYFCMKSLIPVGDIVIDSNLISFGTVGTAVCFTEDNTVEFHPMNRGPRDWNAYESVICTGPRLVTNGVAYVYRSAEGFKDPSLYRPAHRSALGVTKHNKLLLVTVNKPIYLNEMARIMRDLGAVNAVNLDGGSSTALAYKNIVPSHPNRRLTNLLLVYENPARFALIKSRLAPSQVAAESSSKS